MPVTVRSRADKSSLNDGHSDVPQASQAAASGSGSGSASASGASGGSASSTAYRMTSPPSPAPQGEKGPLLINEESNKKWRSAWVRTYTTILMLVGFAVIFLLGHVPLLLLVLFIQVMMFKEVKRLSNVLSTQQAWPAFKLLHWYWFFTAMFFCYGRILSNFNVAIPYHAFVSFALYISGVVVFVLSLQHGYYRYQFEMFAWVHLTLLLIVVQSTFIVSNMFSGLIWFILPALLIISNDTWAYIFGFFFGRTPLIKISPKKTWEGFMGAFFMTLLTGFLLARFLAQFPLMICEKTDLTLGHPQCEPEYTFVPTLYGMPSSIGTVLSTVTGSDWSYVSISPIQWHGTQLALFASIIAPFGGFFASGFKRAYGIKDFGESIPGHGGVTDRMDCQILNAVFVYVYYNTFVRGDALAPTMEFMLARFLTWSQDKQLEFFHQIRMHLQQKGLLKA